MFIKTKILAFIASGFFGASMSNCFATGFLYAEGFTQVTGRLASTFILGGALGWAVVPSFGSRVGHGPPLAPGWRPLIALDYNCGGDGDDAE